MLSYKFASLDRVIHIFNPLQDGKHLALSKLKSVACNNFSLAGMVHSFCDRTENIVGKGD